MGLRSGVLNYKETPVALITAILFESHIFSNTNCESRQRKTSGAWIGSSTLPVVFTRHILF